MVHIHLLAGLAAAILTALQATSPTVSPLAAPEEYEEGQPLSVTVASETEESGARVTLTFSRKTDYRLEESRSRLRVILFDPLDESPQVDRSLESDVVRRIRFDTTSRGTELVFHLGREFESFSSAERSDPFRIDLLFQKRGAPPLAALGTFPTPGAGPGAGRPGAAPSSEMATPPETGPPANDAPGGPRTVVIDPGHGGDEEGAVGPTGLKEKELTLDIARRLRARLQQAGFSVVMTRDEDQSVDLTTRTARANHARAGIFLSIHANSSVRGGARGAETYFLSSGAEEETEPGDPVGAGAELDLVLWEMAQAHYLARSSHLAEVIQSELEALGGRRDRGVKQAPFRVLVGAAMPAALVEVGFLSNPDEEGRLASEEYREKIASLLAAGLERFTQEIEREGEPLASSPGRITP